MTATWKKPVVSGIAFNRDEARINVIGVPDKPGIAYQILGPVADALIDVDMIIQNVGQDGTTDFSFTVPKNDLPRTIKVLEAYRTISAPRACRATTRSARSRSSAWACVAMWRGLDHVPHAGGRGINIQMISTSEIKISVIVDEKYLELAVRVLHKAFGLDQAA